MVAIWEQGSGTPTRLIYLGKVNHFYYPACAICDAVLRNLHTLSESIQRISFDTRLKYPKVPWREICAFRNVVVHDYLGIGLEGIWDVKLMVQKSL